MASGFPARAESSNKLGTLVILKCTPQIPPNSENTSVGVWRVGEFVPPGEMYRESVINPSGLRIFSINIFDSIAPANAPIRKLKRRVGIPSNHIY